MLNYLEHETKVKYNDNLLAKSQEWQWFIDKLQENFEISDIKSWGEFCSNRVPTCDVLSYYIKILNVCDKDWVFTKKEFGEIWLIARYCVGNIPIQNCLDQITYSCCRILLWCVWITKLQNLDNNGNGILDMRILFQKNFFELATLDMIAADKDAIVDYIRNTNVDGMDIPVKLLCDNIDKIKYSYGSNSHKTVTR